MEGELVDQDATIIEQRGSLGPGNDPFNPSLGQLIKNWWKRAF